MSSRKRRAPASKGKGAAVQLATLQDCPACSISNPTKDVGEVWIECEGCQIWHHWACISPNPLDEIDNVDKWWCSSCIAENPSLATTYKVAQRKSGRKSIQLDYANFAAHLPAEPNKWLRVLETRASTTGAFKHYKGSDITDEWLYTDESAMTEPFIVDTAEGLGMLMPHPDLSISAISDIVGPKTPIEVIDVASQSSLSGWTLAEWASYFEDRNREKVRNVISLEVSETPLALHIEAPEMVRKLDWVEQFWGKKVKGKYPTVSRYCLMSVQNSWTDWHIDFAGSSVYYHILRGSKTFLFIAPTPENLKAYEVWSGSETQENTWLGDSVSEVFRVDLVAGNTMIIPTGWIHAVFTPSDSLVIGGNFVHSLNIATQLRVYEIEIITKVPRKFRFPRFVYLCWLVAVAYTTKLQARANLVSPGLLPLDMPPRILEGLVTLSGFLIEQASRVALNAPVSAERRRIAKESIPDHVTDPGALARSCRSLVLAALGRDADDLCNTPAPYPGSGSTIVSAAPKMKLEPVPAAAVRATKRAAAPPVVKNPPSKRFKNWTDPHENKSASPAPPPAVDEGVIIERKVVPVEVDFSNQARSDPANVDAGVRLATIKTSTTKNAVVRRFVAEDGTVRVETRSVVTTVESCSWSPMAVKIEQEPVTVAMDYSSVLPSPADTFSESNSTSPPRTAGSFQFSPTDESPLQGIDLLSAIAASLPPSSASLPLPSAIASEFANTSTSALPSISTT